MEIAPEVCEWWIWERAYKIFISGYYGDKAWVIDMNDKSGKKLYTNFEQHERIEGFGECQQMKTSYPECWVSSPAIASNETADPAEWTSTGYIEA